MTVQFACEACGSPSVAPPRTFRDDAAIACKRCGAKIGTWGDFKERTRRIILAELDGERDLCGASADPLPRLTLAAPSADQA